MSTFVVVGGDAAGTSAASKAKREEGEIQSLSDLVSVTSCSLRSRSARPFSQSSFFRSASQKSRSAYMLTRLLSCLLADCGFEITQ